MGGRAIAPFAAAKQRSSQRLKWCFLVSTSRPPRSAGLAWLWINALIIYNYLSAAAIIATQEKQMAVDTLAGHSTLLKTCPRTHTQAN
jgi:hypothetical protein